MKHLLIVLAAAALIGCDTEHQKQNEIEGRRCVQFFTDLGDPQDAFAACYPDGKFDERWWNAVKELRSWCELERANFKMELEHKYGGRQ